MLFRSIRGGLRGYLGKIRSDWGRKQPKTCFWVSVVGEVTPIRELDNRVIGEGTRGPITTKLQTAFFDVVKGKDSAYRHWLQPVNA